MDKKTFGKEYKLSRGQVDRLTEKALSGDGSFEVPEFGKFSVVKTGTGKTAKINISPVLSGEAVASPSVPVSNPDANLLRDDLFGLSKKELDEIHKAEQIRNLRLKNGEAEREISLRIYADIRKALLEVVLSDLVIALRTVRLSSDELRLLREALEKSVKKVSIWGE